MTEDSIVGVRQPDKDNFEPIGERLHTADLQLEILRQEISGGRFSVEGASTQFEHFFRDNHEKVRNRIVEALNKIPGGENLMAQYRSFGMEFLPGNSLDTNRFLTVETEIPSLDAGRPANYRQAISRKAAEIISGQDAETKHRRRYRRQNSAGITKIQRVSFDHFGSNKGLSRAQIFEAFLSSGDLPRDLLVSIHETAHTANAWGLDFTKGLSSKEKAYLRLGLEPYEKLDASGRSNVLHELHSYFSEYMLCAGRLSLDRTPTSITDLPKYAMYHENVSTHKNHGLSEEENAQMVKRINDDNETSELPEWFRRRYEIAKAGFQNIARVLVIENDLGKTGTYLGRMKDIAAKTQTKDGRMKQWERELVERAKREGIVDKRLNFDAALAKLDTLASAKLAEIDNTARCTRIAINIGILGSLLASEDMPDYVKAQKGEFDAIITNINL